MKNPEILEFIEQLLEDQVGFKTCPTCGLFTSTDIRTCKACQKPCCENCQAVDGSDCMSCGVPEEWKKATRFGEMGKR
jgi:hypothetical protein